MKVRFLKTYQVKAADGPLYEAGGIYDLSDGGAQHFIRRNLAEAVPEVSGAVPAATPKPPDPAKPEGRFGKHKSPDLKKAQSAYRKKQESAE